MWKLNTVKILNETPINWHLRQNEMGWNWTFSVIRSQFLLLRRWKTKVMVLFYSYERYSKTGKVIGYSVVNDWIILIGQSFKHEFMLCLTTDAKEEEVNKFYDQVLFEINRTCTQVCCDSPRVLLRWAAI